MLTLNSGQAIDLAQVVNELDFIANSPMPADNDGELDLLVKSKEAASFALGQFIRVCG